MKAAAVVFAKVILSIIVFVPLWVVWYRGNLIATVQDAYGFIVEPRR